MTHECLHDFADRIFKELFGEAKNNELSKSKHNTHTPMWSINVKAQDLNIYITKNTKGGIKTNIKIKK